MGKLRTVGGGALGAVRELTNWTGSITGVSEVFACSCKFNLLNCSKNSYLIFCIASVFLSASCFKT